MKSKQSHFLLVLLLGLLLGGGLVGILLPGAQDPLADEARHLAAPASDDDDERPEQAAANLAGQNAGAAVEAGFGRTELDARGQEVGTRLPAAIVLVQSPTGAPIADALVEARNEQGITDQRRTDAEGRATISLPKSETIALLARSDAWFPAGIAQHPFGEPVILVLGEAANVSGVVRDAKGEPVAGASLEARGPAGSPRSAPRKRERSDEQGRFKLPPLVPGTYDLWVEPPETRGPVTVVAGLYVAAGPSTRDVELAKGRTLTGKVRDARTGALLGGAKVEVRIDVRQGQLRGFATERKVMTDELGAFTVPALPLGAGRVIADAQGHTPASVGVTIAATDGVQEVELALEAGVSLFGRTLALDGTPVSGAEVVFGWWTNDRFEWSERKAQSDAEGRYDLGELPVRDHAFVAMFKEGHAADAIGLGKLVPGERREVDIRFQQGLEVRGSVRGVDGKPVLAGIKLVPRLGAERFSRPIAADVEGAFALRDVVPFAYRLEVLAEGYIPFARDVNLEKGKPVHDLGTIVLEKAFAVAGVVVRRLGSMGVPAARVNLVPVSDRSAPRRGAVTDEFGEFVCSDLKAGTYRVFVDGVGIAQPREVPLLVTVPAQRSVRAVVDRIEVPPTGGVYGRVLDAASGAPMTAFSVPGIDGRRLGRGDGSYWITGLPAGRTDLRFDARGYQSAVLPGVYVKAGDLVRVRDLFLQPGGRLDVVVRDPAGKPIPANQLRLTLTDTQMRTLAHHLQPFETNAEKAVYRYDGLALSTFTLRVEGPKGLLPWSQNVEVLSTQGQRVDVRLQPVPPPKPPAKAQPKGAPGKGGGKPQGPQQPKK